MTGLASMTYRFHVEGMMDSIRRAADPDAGYTIDPDHPWVENCAYYGHPVGVAVWHAKYVMREARRLGLLRDYEQGERTAA